MLITQSQHLPSLQHRRHRKDSRGKQNCRSCKCRHNHPIASRRHRNNPDRTSCLYQYRRRSAKFSTHTVLHNYHRFVRTHGRYQLVSHHSVCSALRFCQCKSRMARLEKTNPPYRQRMLNIKRLTYRHIKQVPLNHRLPSKVYMPLTLWRLDKNTFLRWMRHQLAFQIRLCDLRSSSLLPRGRCLRHFHRQEDPETQKQHCYHICQCRMERWFFRGLYLLENIRAPVLLDIPWRISLHQYSSNIHA